MNKLSKGNYIVLVILILIFIFPGVAAYVFYTHPQWLPGQSLNNKGKLLNPPELLGTAPGPAKWRLVLWNPNDCKKKCLKQIDKLARVRLALGRRLLNVDELIVLTKQSQFPSQLNDELHEKNIHLLLLSKEEQARQKLLDERMRIFIANPNNYLVLAYEAKTKPEDIFHDIQQLLTTSEKGK
ncbi:Uncharacterised protein [Legionella beliardensis]|uniref:Transmembrane protein n=1 Tax=Legionella beliardensis TaxID=91822 RepID=A0A378HYY1_9GAMM|nr:hypothetical protein [Legionella beliardensis]STX28119.1 Uncharacterised protein [Legionella beliardensis]